MDSPDSLSPGSGPQPSRSAAGETFTAQKMRQMETTIQQMHCEIQDLKVAVAQLEAVLEAKRLVVLPSPSGNASADLQARKSVAGSDRRDEKAPLGRAPDSLSLPRIQLRHKASLRPRSLVEPRDTPNDQPPPIQLAPAAAAAPADAEAMPLPGTPRTSERQPSTLLREVGLKSPQKNPLPSSPLREMTRSESLPTEEEKNYDEALPNAPERVEEHMPLSIEESEWRECLDFFFLSHSEFPFRQIPQRSSPTNRAGFKRKGILRLSGTTVSLYDYQLFGCFKLLRLQASGISFAYLADGAGLGKTFTLLATFVVYAALREMLSHFRQHPEQHRGECAKPTERCAYRVRANASHRCICESPVAMEIAACLVHGPGLILTSSRLAHSSFTLAQKYLADDGPFLVCGEYDKHAMTVSERNLAGLGVVSKPAYTEIHWNPEADKVVIISSWQRLKKLQQDFLYTRRLPRSPNEAMAFNRLCPGFIAIDETHIARPVLDDLALLRTFARPWYSARNNIYPPVLFLSGTPYEEDPGELGYPLDVAWTPKWDVQGSPMYAAQERMLRPLRDKYASIVAAQKEGSPVPPADVQAYKVGLKQFLERFMVRREAKDAFRGVKISTLPDLRVTMVWCRVPEQYVDSCQQLSDLSRSRVEALRRENADPSDSLPCVHDVLREKEGGALVRDLRLAASFPGVIQTALSGVECPWTFAEIGSQLRAVQFEPERTALWSKLEAWTADSSQVDVLLDIIAAMGRDKSPTSLGGKKMVVFANSEAEALFVYYRLKTEGSRRSRSIRPLWLPSAVPAGMHPEYFGRFAKTGFRDPNIFISTIWVAGTGIQLTVANYCVLFSPPPERIDAEQAFHRIHRLGQQLPTHHWMLIAAGNPIARRLKARHEGKYVSEGDSAWKVFETDPPDAAADIPAEASEQVALLLNKTSISDTLEDLGDRGSKLASTASTNPGDAYREGLTAREVFDSRFPEGFEIVPNDGAGLQCAFLAIMDSLHHQVPGDRIPTLEELQMVYAIVAADNPEFDMENTDNYRIDQAAETLRSYGRNQDPMRHYQLGYIYPVSDAHLDAALVPVDDDNANSPSTIIWVHNNSAGDDGWESAHFSGLRGS